MQHHILYLSPFFLFCVTQLLTEMRFYIIIYVVAEKLMFYSTC